MKNLSYLLKKMIIYSKFKTSFYSKLNLFNAKLDFLFEIEIYVQ